MDRVDWLVSIAVSSVVLAQYFSPYSRAVREGRRDQRKKK